MIREAERNENKRDNGIVSEFKKKKKLNYLKRLYYRERKRERERERRERERERERRGGGGGYGRRWGVR